MRRKGLGCDPVTSASSSVIHFKYAFSMTGDVPANHTRQLFPKTRWSAVLAVKERSPGAAIALEAICQAYWYPLYAYVRRCGQGPHDAEDLTQEFFCQLLEKGWLAAADRNKGKLRTFLVVAMKHFMSKEWRKAVAQKRGGGLALASFDTAFAETRFGADPTTLAPEETFDRQWALTLLDLTLNQLREEFVAVGKATDFDTIKGNLLARRGTIDYEAVARRIGAARGPPGWSFTGYVGVFAKFIGIK